VGQEPGSGVQCDSKVVSVLRPVTTGKRQHSIVDRSLVIRLALVATAVQICMSCSSLKFPSGKLVMFSTVGPRSFQGTVFVVRPEGSSITTVLKPQTLLEYDGAYGNSLETFILASASQSTGGNNSVTSIVQYFPDSSTITPVQQELRTGQEGNGIPSPDNSQFVAGIGAVGSSINLWVSDFKTKQFRQLGDGAYVAGPQWVGPPVVRRKCVRSHTATFSSRYSWCSPPSTSLILIQQSGGNSCLGCFGLGRRVVAGSGIPGPRLACGRPRL